MKQIFITSSNLAKYTGDNKYDTLEKTVNELLKKCGIEDRYVPKTNVEECLVNLSMVQLNELKKELQLPETASLEQIEKNIQSKIMGQSYSASLSEDKSKELLEQKVKDKPLLQKLTRGMKQDLRMRRGNIKENANLNKIQSCKGIQIGERNSKMYTKELYRCDEYILILRGKVDGQVINEGGEGVIIESKNRTKNLFKTLRVYEQVQLEAYMFLTEFKKALLTEHYNDTEFCIEYDHDEEFWDQCLQKTIEFMNVHIKPYLK
jgi:hypothetical protein